MLNRIRSLIFVTAVLSAAPITALAETRLLMVEQPGCVYCAEWDAVIAPIYPKTPEGAVAALERVQLNGPYPWGYSLGPRPIYTPTFILVADGVERGRIDGYPGEDFFWGLLGRILTETGDLPSQDERATK